MIDKRDVQAFFDRLAPDWDAGMVRNEAVIARILDNAGVCEGCTVSVVVLRKLNLKKELTRKQYLSVLIPISANIIFIVVIWSLVYKYIPNNLQINYIGLILAVLLIFSNISILKITNNIVKENQLKFENEKLTLCLSY